MVNLAGYFRNSFNRSRRIRRDEEGAVAVEFALTLPVYLAMIGLIIEGSWMLYHQQAVHFAAEEATRFALVNYDATKDEIKAVAKEELSLLDTRNLAADAIIVENDANAQGVRQVSISITFLYEPLFPILGFFQEEDSKGFEFTGSSDGFFVTSLNPAILEELEEEVVP